MQMRTEKEDNSLKLQLVQPKLSRENACMTIWIHNLKTVMISKTYTGDRIIFFSFNSREQGINCICKAI